MNKIELRKMSFLSSFSVYLFAALLLYFTTHYLIPNSSELTGEEPILFWFLGAAVCVFIPLILVALVIIKNEGYEINTSTWVRRMRFRKMTKKDWVWTIGGAFAAILLSGVVMALMKFIYGDFKTSPSFMEFIPLSISGKYWMFLIWLPYWILNIMGEEILWRGVMQPRMELTFGKYTWIVISLLWVIFHLAFGWKLLIVMLPMLFIIPFVMQKTKNSWNGVIMHALVNGPSFIAIALGVI